MSAPAPVTGSKVVALPSNPGTANVYNPFISPANELPSAATPPETKDKVAANVEALESSEQLPRALKKLMEGIDYFCNHAVEVSGYPLFYLGSALLVFGTGHTLFVILKTLAVKEVLTSSCLGTLLLGGLLRELGKAMRNGTETNTSLANLLYIPLRVFARLSI